MARQLSSVDITGGVPGGHSPPEPTKIIGFGALNYDRLHYVTHIADADDEVEILNVHESPGGSAANTIHILAQLGVKTGFVGKLGEDAEGEKMLDEFGVHGVDVSGIKISETARTGNALGFVDRKGERALYILPGANDTLELAEIDMEYLGSAELLHLSSFVAPRMLELQKSVVEILRKMGTECTISISIGALYARLGLAALSPLLKSSFVFLNAEELHRLTGENYSAGAEHILRAGAAAAIVTLGSEGCYVRTASESHNIHCKPTKAIDTTGAGDAFVAGYLHGWLRGKPVMDCGTLGNELACRAIAQFGTRI